MAENAYDGSSIQILDGLDAIRRRPGVCIGSTDSKGLRHLVWEIVDNSIDEALSGHGDTVRITIEKDNMICVEDGGRGMPVGMHASGVPTVQVTYTVLYAGGKFGTEGGYKTSSGLHGVGAGVVNVLSEWVEVTVHRDGKIYRTSFSNGECEVSELEAIGKTNRVGGEVRFKADKTMLSTMKYSFHQIAEYAQEDTFLLEDLKLVVCDECEGKEHEEVYHYKQGLTAFMEYLRGDKQVFHKPVAFNEMNSSIKVDCTFQYTDEYQGNIFSFVNIVHIKDDGTHKTGAKDAFTGVLSEYARKSGLLKGKNKNSGGSGIREGLTTILSLGMPESLLQFEGQTKDRLGTVEAGVAMDSIVSGKLSFFLEENKEPAITLIKKMWRTSTARKAACKTREGVCKRKTRGKTEKILSGRLTSTQSKDVGKKELYLVEGDSARSSTKQGRDGKYQAILPLRGKMLNTEKASIANIEKNEELNTIVRALGAGVGADFHVEDSNYHGVIIMIDADTDGAHIQILLLMFLYRYIRELIEQGTVYIALPPLHKLQKGKGIQYVWTDEELDELRKTFSKSFSLQRYKGLGEIDADQLWGTTICPETRTLIQVTVDDVVVTEKRVSVLMGDKTSLRRDWVKENVFFTLGDDYEAEVRR